MVREEMAASDRKAKFGERSRAHLVLQLEAPATPARVALAAAFLADAVRAADNSLPDDALTLVVDNYALKAGLRPQTIAGKRVVDLLRAVLDNPDAAADGDKRAADVAMVFADEAPRLLAFSPSFRLGGARKPLRVLDERFIAIARAVGDFGSSPALRGATTVYSKILRIGRTKELGPVRVRIIIDGRPQDIPIADGLESLCFDMAKQGRLVPVNIEALWRSQGDSDFILDVRRSKVVSIDTSWAPVSGADAVRELRDSVGASFDDLDAVEELLGVGESH